MMEKVRKISKRSCFRQIAACLLVYCLFFNASVAFAPPPPMNAGNIVVDYLNPPTDGVLFDNAVANITKVKAPHQAIINYEHFNVDSGKTLKFLQENVTDAVLNRITWANSSLINGNLTARGRVFIVNPAGIVFGSNASVNVAQLVASGLHMSDADFTKAIGNPLKKMKFGIEGGGSVTVDADGTITASDSVYLVGTSVFNNGAILCPDGLVVMAAGNTVKLGQPGSAVIVDIGDLNASSGNIVQNNGTVGQAGSPVSKLVLAAGDVFSQAITDVGELAAVAIEDIEITGDVDVTGDLTLTAGDDVYVGYDYDKDLFSVVSLTSGGKMTVTSGLNGVEPYTHTDIKIGGNATAGDDMALTTREDSQGDVVVKGKLTTTQGSGGNITVTAGDGIELDGSNADGAMTITADTSGAGEDGGNVLAEGALVANSDIDITGNEIMLKEAVDAGGNLTITGRQSIESNWGNVYALSTLDAGGDIQISVTGEEEIAYSEPVTSYYPGEIHLSGDVTAGGNIALYNNTEAHYDYDLGKGVTLQAGNHVILANAIGDNGEYPEGFTGDGYPPAFCAELWGDTELTIIAGAGDGVDDGRIYAEYTNIWVGAKTSLTLQQDPTLDLGDGQWNFGNQIDTDLTLISNEGSVIATHALKLENAADQWESIGATAKDNIDLAGMGMITTTELLSYEGDIAVQSFGSNLFAMEDITAEKGNVTLYASCWIYDYADIFAGQNVNIESPLVLLGGEWVWDDTASGWIWDYDAGENGGDWVHVENGAWVWQGNQYITAQNGILTAERWIHKYTPGELHMYAGWDSSDGSPAIDLQYPGYIIDSYGNPTVLTAGNLYMRANGDIQIAGDITALGWWRSPGNVYQNYPWQQLFFETDYDGEPVLWPWAAGGVSIISEKGKIYTAPQVPDDMVTLNGPVIPDGPVLDDSWLNVRIEGYSDDVTHRSVLPEGAQEWYEGLMFQACLVWNAPLNEAAGVDLPYGDGKSAIVLMSKEDLKLAGYPDLDGDELDGGYLVNSVSGVLRTGASLDAYGRYAATEEFSLEGVDSWLEWEEYIYDLSHKYAGLVDLEALGDGFNAYAVKQGYDPHTDFEDENIENRVDFVVFKGLVEDYLDSIGGFELTAVDDRPGVGFLAEPGVEIGGFVRNEGVPIDVAIYAASTENDVVVAENARIAVEPGFPYQPVYASENNYDEPRYEFDSGATVVLDAYDTVTVEGIVEHLLWFDNLEAFHNFLDELRNSFGEDIDLAGFETVGMQALIDLGYIEEQSEFEEWASENFGIFKDLVTDLFVDHFKDFDFGDFFKVANFRLEACSRRTGTLGQAIDEGTLPFADTTWVMEWFLGDAYVLRGEGDLGITRAWVLDDNPVIIPEPEPEPEPKREPIPPAPVYDITAVPGVERVGFGPAGCPALLVWLAGEIGVPEETIQIYVANTFAYSTDIQPCEMCARLKGAATTLQDPEGTAIAALGRVINEFVTTPAPPSPEQMASVATTLAEHTDDGTYYAAAGQWIDALVAYVTILNTEMRWSIDDSIALAMGKYGAPVTASGNASLVAYVQARLAAIGG